MPVTLEVTGTFAKHLMPLPTLPQTSTCQEKIDRLNWTDGQIYSAYGLRFGLRTNNPALLDATAAHLPLGWLPSPTSDSENNTVDILYSLRFEDPSPHPASPREASPKGGKCDEEMSNLGEEREENPKNFNHTAIKLKSEPSKSSQTKDASINPFASPEESKHLLYCGSALLSRTENLAELLTTLENHAELLTAFRAKDYLFIHAGVVAWEGKAILIPGRSMSGKTSLVRALLKAGATYYSDEFALLDKEGIVHPYSVPLSIRKGGNIVGCKTALESLGIEPGTEPLPVGLVVIAKYQRYARWKPEILPPAQAMLALMDNAVAARGEPAFSMPILKKVAMNAKTIASKRGEAKRVASAILEEMR